MVRSLAAACTLLALTACSPAPVKEPAGKEKMTYEPHMVAMSLKEYGKKVIRGTVVAVRPVDEYADPKEDIVIDVGGESPVETGLAGIEALQCGGSNEADGSNFTRYQQQKIKAIPAGSEVVAFRNDGGAGDYVYLHILDANGKAPAGMSVNEKLVRLGEAGPYRAPFTFQDPGPWGATADEIHELLVAWKPKKGMPAQPDRVYWPALRNAWISAWSKKAGGIADCFKAAQKAHQEKLAAEEAAKQYEPGGIYYNPDFDTDFGDGHCDTCRWASRGLRKLF